MRDYYSFVKYGINPNEGLCRACVNKKYDLDLQPCDCDYDAYRENCKSCQERKNIVLQVRFLKRIRITFKCIFTGKKLPTEY